MTQFNGKNITVLRDIVRGDASYDANKAQALVRQADGSEISVAKNDLKEVAPL